LIQAVAGGETVPALKTPLLPAPEMLKTVMLAATAAASAGIAHGAPMSVTVRGVLSARTELLSELYCRQGVMATKGRGTGLVTSGWRPEARASRPP
jgi:hypothetical protein